MGCWSAENVTIRNAIKSWTAVEMFKITTISLSQQIMRHDRMLIMPMVVFFFFFFFFFVIVFFFCSVVCLFAQVQRPVFMVAEGT